MTARGLRKREQKRLQEIQERMDYGALEDKRSVARREILRVKLTFHEMRLAWTSLADEWRRQMERWTGNIPPGPPYVEDDLKMVVGLLLFFASAAYVGELLAAFATGQGWVNAHWLVAGCVGVVAALLYMVAVEVFWILAPKERNNPLPQWNRLRRAVLWLTVINVVLLAGFGISRILPLPPLVSLVQLTLLCVFLPLFATGTFTLAKWLGHRNSLAKRYLVLQVESRRYIILIDQMEGVLEPEELERILRSSQRVEAEEEADK